MNATELAPEVAERHGRLVEAVRGMRGRGATTDAARTLAIAGGALVALGLVLVVLGWTGASRSTEEWEQIPYLISGGLLGVALVFAGGFFYFASWQAQAVQASRREAATSRELLETMQRIEKLLTERTEER